MRLLRPSIVLALPLAIFAVACLKGGSTGTPTTDDTGDVSEDGGATRKHKGEATGRDPGLNGGGTDDTGKTPATESEQGTDDTSGPATTTPGHPGDPCTVGSGCLSGVCPKSTKTCDGCLLEGGGCKDDSDCCPISASSGLQNYCGADQKCAIGKVQFAGYACVLNRDVCRPKGSACTGTGSQGQGPTYCTTPCTTTAECGGDPHGPVCQQNGICGHLNCTSSLQCQSSVSGHICQAVTSSTTRCGCDTNADCPTSATCHKSKGAAFAYCW